MQHKYKKLIHHELVSEENCSTNYYSIVIQNLMYSDLYLISYR